MRVPIWPRVFLAVLLACPAGWTQENPSIHAVEIRGTERPLHLETRAGEELDSARVARDVRRLWTTGWFDDIRVEAAGGPAGTDLVFTVVEKPRLYLRRVRFEPDRFQRRVRIEPGASIDRVAGRRLAAALRRELLEEGYKDAGVEAELIPVGFLQADLLLRVEPGERYRVREVRFSGNPGLERSELRRALHSIRSQWLRRPGFSERAVEADLERLQSLYFSRGYLDAQVALEGVEFTADKAAITISAHSGPRYQVDQVKLNGTALPGGDGEFPARELCRCLLDARRESEQQGQLDFAARLEAEKTAGRRVALTARTETGQPYTVGRIEFRGHHSFSDRTLRRTLRLEEGESFDRGLLRQSLARLDRLGLFEPVREDNVALRADPGSRRVHVTISLEEKPRGRWSLSGPVGPARLGGPLQFAVASRLPGWGQGIVELSTYYATVSLFAFTPPIWRLLPWTPKIHPIALTALERPYLPGQRWQSGFRWSPQLGWRGTVAGCATSRLHLAARSALQGREIPPPLAVPAEWRSSQAGTLLCEAPRSGWAWARALGATAADWLLAPF